MCCLVCCVGLCAVCGHDVATLVPERKRRDDIKDCFDLLRVKLPDLGGDKQSRAHVLQKTTEYVRQLEAALQAQTAEEEALRSEVEQLRRLLDGDARTARRM